MTTIIITYSTYLGSYEDDGAMTEEGPRAADDEADHAIRQFRSLQTTGVDTVELSSRSSI